MKRKGLSLLCASVLVSTTLFGCGGKTAEVSSRSAEESSIEATTAAASTEETSTAEASTTEASTTEVSTTEASTVEPVTPEVSKVADNTEATTQVNLSEVDPVHEDIPIEGTPGAGDAGVKNVSGIRRIVCVEDAMFWKNTRYSITFSEQATAERIITGRVNFGDTETFDEKSKANLSPETAAKIEALYEEYQMWRWDGFDMFAQVTDGATMDLTIEFNDGKKLNMKGYMVYPRGYKEFYAELEEILQPLFDKETTEETEPETDALDKLRSELKYQGNPGAGDAGVRNESGIKELSCGWGSGWGYWSKYEFTFSETASVKVDIQEMLTIGFGQFSGTDVEDEYTLDKETAAKIEALYDKYQMWRWKGFNREAVGVTDGSGNWIEIVFQDGEKLKAEGYMTSPDGYGEFFTEMEEILAPRIEESKLRLDDTGISEIRKECLALLREEKYYNAAGECVTVMVSKMGEIRVSNVGKRTEDLKEELMLKLYNSTEFGPFFQSEAYREGGDTILEFTKDESSGTWRYEIRNQNSGSAYYRAH